MNCSITSLLPPMATTEGNLKHSHIKEARALRHAVVLTWQHVPKQPSYSIEIKASEVVVSHTPLTSTNNIPTALGATSSGWWLGHPSEKYERQLG